MKCDYAAALLKGIVEHDDGTVYFASFGGFGYYQNQAVQRGLIVDEALVLRATPRGLDYYIRAGLWLLPNKGRAYLWDWSPVGIG